MKKQIAKRLLSILMIVSLLFNTTVISFGETADDKAEIIFKYTEADSSEFIPVGTNLIKGRDYELHVFLKDVKALNAFTLPFHFNPDVIQLISYETDEIVSEWEKVVDEDSQWDVEDSFFYGTSGVLLDENFTYSSWFDGAYLTLNEQTPYFNSSKGYMTLTLYRSTGNADINGEQCILKIRFKAVNCGSVDFRDATDSDGELGVDYDGTAPNGFRFSSLGGVEIDVEKSIENKMVYEPATGIKISDFSDAIGASQTVKFEAEVYPSGAEQKVIWESNDETVATVDADGNVKGVKPGKVTITASTADGKFSDTCEVEITDLSVPTVPENLTIEWVTGSRAVFSWSNSTGYHGVDGYIVYRDGKEIARVDGTTYEDLDLTKDKKYQYTVAAYYGDSISKQSKPLDITPKAVNITAVIPENYSSVGGSGKVNFKVYYDDTHNAKGAKVSLSGGKTSQAAQPYEIENIKTGVSGNSNWFSFDFDMSQLSESGDYKFVFAVEDADGFNDTYEAQYSVDVTPPSKLTGFEAKGYEKYNMLSWNKAIEANTEKYIIYRSIKEDGPYELLTEINNRDKVTYKDSNVDPGTTYYYYVVAEDVYGQQSEKTEIKSATPLADATAPEVLYIKVTPDRDVLTGTVKVEFTVYDEVSLDKIVFQYSTEEGVWVDYDEKTLTSDKVTFDFDTTRFNDGDIKLRAIVYDKTGNPSDGTPERTYVIDNKGPSAPTNLTASNVLSTSLHLSWNDVNDDDREYYVVEYRKAGSGDALSSIDNIKALGTDVTSLTPDTKYEFYVTAYDKYGNRGATSGVLYVTTSKDKQAPKVTTITPYYKNISTDIEVSFTATDDCGVKSAEIQVSYNGGAWETVGTVDIAMPGTKVTFKHTLEIAKYNEGTISIRAIPVDVNDNRGDSSDAALSQSYYIDRTPVDVPLNVVAKACEDADAIEVRWDVTDFEQDRNKDFLCYIIYRSESENDNYEIVNPNCTNINYIDYNVEFNKTYYYKVKTSDKCGNLSEFSNVASASILDNEPPVFYSVYPKNNGYIGTDMTITANVKDNNKLSYVELWYMNASGNWVSLEKKNASSASMTANFVLDSNKFTEGTYKFKLVTNDTTNVHEVTYPELTYHIDRTAPVISNLQATAGEKSVTLTWDCADTSDLSGYHVYYKTEGGYYKSTPDATVSPKDKTVTISGLNSDKKYQFKLVAIDYAGNKSHLENGLVSPLPGDDIVDNKDTTPPVIMMNVPSVFIVGEEGNFYSTGSYDNIAIKSYKWEFGDGSESEYKDPVHAYGAVGEYQVKLYITDTSGNVATGIKTVKVKEKQNIAVVSIKVVDDSGNRIPDANVIFDYSTEKASKYISNSQGIVLVETEAGTHSVGVYKDGYLPAEKKVVAHNNTTTELIVRLIKKNIVIGSLTWERMTLEDIIEAGIDTSDPENQNIYSFEVKIVIGEEEIVAKGHKAVNSFDDNFTPIELETSVPVSSGGKSMNQKIYIYDFNDKTNFSYDSSDSSLGSNQPQTFVATLSTPGEVSWLKEFFDVELTVSNQADAQFVIDDCEVVLNYDPLGLTVMTDLENAQPSARVELGQLAGQQTQTVNWVLRGDVEGEYPISADFYGELRGFDTAIEAVFECDKPIKVYGDSGMSIVLESENSVNGYDDYSFRIGLRNESPMEKYLPNASVEETDYIKAVKNYQNYIEKDGDILRLKPDTLYPRETLYSDYILTGLKPEQLTIEFVQKELSDKFGISYNSLPVYYRIVPQYSFNKSLITLFSENEELPATIKLYRNEEKTVTINVSKYDPDSSRYVCCANEKIYVKHEGGEYSLLGTTDENGCIDYTFSVPADYEGENYRISIRANRTGEKYIDIFVLGDENKVYLEGIVTDQYGNPVSKASVMVGREREFTDYSGRYRFAELERGKTRIVIKKDGYETIDKNLVLNVGHVIKNYKMKQTPKHKPKIISVSSNIADDATDEIIVPLGLDMDYTLDVKAKALGGSQVEKYIIELVKADDTATIVSESTTSEISYNLKDMQLGDSLRIYVIDDNSVESLRTNLPVRIVETPFVNILNVGDSLKTNKKMINECYSFELPVSKLFKEQWLTGSFATNWNELFNKFKVRMTLDVADATQELQSETEFDINWFDYIGFDVTAKYDFTNGDLIIFPGYITARGREVYENNTYSKFAFEETIDESIKRASSGKYDWLEAWNRFSWYIDGGFSVEFNLDSKTDVDTWKGSFNLWSEDSQDFYGTYYRKMNKYEYIVNDSKREYLEGVWNKNLEVHQDEIIELSEEGINNSRFVMDYTTSTQGSWKNGISHITLTSESENEIYLLPEARIKGRTTLGGDYYILGYRYKLYGGSESTMEYDKTFDGTSPSLASLDDMMELALAGLDSAELEPIVKLNSLQNSGVDGVIASNVFANTENAISDGENKILVYLNNNEARQIGEQSQLVYRRYDDGSWSDEMVVVEDDKTADYTPYIKETPYGIMSAWANSTGNIYSNQEMTMADISAHIASQLSISLAVYDTETQSWSDAISLNENNYLDYAPVIASQKTEDNPLVMVCWIANQDNDMTDATRRDEIMYSIFDGTSWSTPESVLGGAFGSVSDLKIEEHNGVFYVLFSMQTINDGGTSEDTSDDVLEETKLYSAMYSNGRWSLHRTLNGKETADGFSGFMVDEDELQAVYTNSLYVNRANAATREIREERTENSLINTASEMISIQEDGFTALAWISNPANTQKIYLNTFKNGEWSENIEVASASSDEVIGNLNAFVDGNKVVVVYNKYVYDTVGDEYTLKDVQLCSESIVIESDVSVEDLTADDISVMYNKDVHFQVKIKNNGINDVESYTVRLTGNAFTQPIEKVVDETIKGGEEKVVNIDWTATVITDSFEVAATVIADGKESTANHKLTLTPYDTEIGEVTLEETGEELTAIVKLENNGYIDVLDYKVTVEKEDGTVLKTVASTETLTCDEIKTINIDLTEFMSELSTENTRLKFAISTNLVEFDENNNFMFKNIQTDNVDHSMWSGTLDFLYTGEEQLDKKYFADTQISVDVVTDEHAAVDADESGNFALQAPSGKTYDVIISRRGVLERTVKDVQFSDAAALSDSAIKLIPGDVVQDSTNSINPTDIARMVYLIGYGSTDEAFDECADFDCSGGISLDDLTVLLSNAGKNSAYYNVK